MTEGLSFQNILLVKGRHKKFKPRQSVLLITMFYCLFNAREDSSVQFSSGQFSHSVVSDSLWPHESQHTRPPVHHQLPDFTQTHVYRVGDAIQHLWCHLILCCTLLFMPPIPPSIRVFSNESTLRKPIAKLQGCHHLPSGTHPLFLFAFH